MKLSDQITRRQLFVAFGTSQQTGSLSSVDLAATRDGASVTLTASDGSVAPIAGADTSTAGVMTAADKGKLDDLPPPMTRELASRSEIAAATVGAAIGYLRTGGYATPGDGGGALYVRVATAPSHPLKVQSADGAWWELVPERGEIDIRQAGAKGDGMADDTTAIQSAIDYGATVLVPKGTFRITAALNSAVDDQRIQGMGGWSVVHQTATDTNIINVTHSRVSFEGLFLKGNNAAEGEAEGIHASGVSALSIKGCYFDEIGEQDDVTGAAGPIRITGNSTRVQVHGNFFLAACTNSRGGDIAVTEGCTDVSLTDNISVSNCDAFVLFNARRGVIADNIIIRNNGRRHGILAGYDGRLVECAITGNLVIGTAWTGIYLSNAEAGTDPTASVSVIGNHVYRCGGGDPANGALQASIYLAGYDGVTCQGNIVTEAGIDTNGVARAYATPAILVSEVMRGGAITGNHIYRPTGQGIQVVGSDADELKDVVIANNIIREAVKEAIDVVNNSGTAIIKRVRVTGNQINTGTVDAPGIRLMSVNSGEFHDIEIEHNSIVSEAASSTKDGIYVYSPAWPNRVRWNRIEGFNRACVMGVTAANREIGNTFRFDENEVVDCSVGFASSISSGDRGFICGNVWKNVTTKFGGSGAQEMFEARRLLADASGNTLYELWADAAPAGGTWLKGDRVKVRTPAAGGFEGHVCVTAGTPGAWKGYGAVEA